MTKNEKVNGKEVISDNKAGKKYANFWQRLCAFIIDMFLISMISSLISQPFINQDNYKRLSDEVTTTTSEYKNKKIDTDTYVNRVADISYDMAKQNGISAIIEIAISILYFIVWQFKSNGQTLGKKLMKIKIVKKDETQLTINDILFRSLLIDYILFDMIVLCFTVFSNKNTYFYGVGIFEFIQYAIVFISSMLILSRKDKQGLHDIIVKTEVIKSE